jgi:hypothetical protein
MTFDYASIRDSVVIPQLEAFGVAAVLTQPGIPTGPDYDPTPGVPVVYPSTVLQTSFTMKDKAGTVVEENDAKYILSPEGDPDPDLQGTLTVGGITLQVISLKPLQPGPTVMFWYVHCRK